jgi:hypothetical protein
MCQKSKKKKVLINREVRKTISRLHGDMIEGKSACMYEYIESGDVMHRGKGRFF